MNKLLDYLSKKVNQTVIPRSIFNKPPTPIFFGQQYQTNFEKLFKDFLSSTPIVSIRNTYKEQLEELFFIRNASLNEEDVETKIKLDKFLKIHSKNGSLDFAHLGVWVYYPWTGNLDHLLDPDLYQVVRTARNKYLLTAEEQERFRKFVVGIAGLSIGNSVALSLAYSGGCETMKLADPDTFATTNLNRVRVPIHYLGIKKAYVAAQQIYEVNPYAKLKLYPEGINSKNLEEFLLGSPKLNLVVDEMDDLKLKIFIRLAARAVRLPLVMATDNGDNSIIDIDRFDLNPNIKPFDTLPQLELNSVIGGIDFGEPLKMKIKEKVQLATKIVGAENAVYRMQESLLHVGNDIVSWPQLGTAAFSGGSILTYVIKKIALGENIKPGKTHIGLDEMFLTDFNSSDQTKRKKIMTAKLIAYINNPNLVSKSNYSVWNIKASDFPKNSQIENQLKFMINYAVMAPSTHNTQPWTFTVRGHQIYLYFDAKRWLKISDPTKREMYISLGACIMNLRVALSYFGFKIDLEYFPGKEKNLVAKISCRKDFGDKHLASLLPAITRRFNDKSLYERKPIPSLLLHQIQSLNLEKELRISIITDKNIKNKIGSWISSSSRTIMNNSDFRTELAGWLRHNFTKQADGIPGFTAGFNDIQSILGPFLIKTLNPEARGESYDQKTVSNSAALVVISSHEDQSLSWTKAGELYEKILLFATQNNLKSATLASIIEGKDEREKLKQLLGISLYPQVFMRIGYSKNKFMHSPRLSLGQVLLSK